MSDQEGAAAGSRKRRTKAAKEAPARAARKSTKPGTAKTGVAKTGTAGAGVTRAKSKNAGASKSGSRSRSSETNFGLADARRLLASSSELPVTLSGEVRLDHYDRAARWAAVSAWLSRTLRAAEKAGLSLQLRIEAKGELGGLSQTQQQVAAPGLHALAAAAADDELAGDIAITIGPAVATLPATDSRAAEARSAAQAKAGQEGLYRGGLRTAPGPTAGVAAQGSASRRIPVSSRLALDQVLQTIIENAPASPREIAEALGFDRRGIKTDLHLALVRLVRLGAIERFEGERDSQSGSIYRYRPTAGAREILEVLRVLPDPGSRRLPTMVRKALAERRASSPSGEVDGGGRPDPVAQKPQDSKPRKTKPSGTKPSKTKARTSKPR